MGFYFSFGKNVLQTCFFEKNSKTRKECLTDLPIIQKFGYAQECLTDLPIIQKFGYVQECLTDLPSIQKFGSMFKNVLQTCLLFKNK